MDTPIGHIGAPPDAVAWAALVVAACVLLLGIAFPRRVAGALERVEDRWLVLALATAALLLSAGYVAYYLHGGPRIVDATSYWLEARGLSLGQLVMPVPHPSGSFRGRFLVTPPGATAIAVIFPPGYPALLALGFLLRAPMAVGPVIAALLVAATYALARQLTGRRDVALCAALLSVLCAALRYHTADTMSHGWAALLLAVTLAAAARGGRWPVLLAGIACGWLVATRPVTGALGLALATALLLRAGRERWLFPLALMPGLALLLVHQHAATGTWLSSSQLRYYALADGPPGCFRYGFGHGIGCRYEHADFVRAHLAHGYGLAAALGTSGRRLAWHTLDIANLAPLALLVPYAMIAGWRRPGIRVLSLGTLGVILAYAPFYFDGSYPGGGARMLAEALPLEQVLLAWALCELRAARFAAPLSLAGFAFHASYAHRALSEREGGRPMFEASVLAHAGVDHGLVFVGTDHGFDLGFVPGAFDAKHGIVVARWRGDAHDALLWDALGRPQAYRYRYDPLAARAVPRVTPQPLHVPATLRFEAAAEWPPLSVAGGWAHPDFPSGSCAAGAPGLRLLPTSGRVRVTLEIDVPRAGPYELDAGFYSRESTRLSASAGLGSRHWSRTGGVERDGCWRMPPEQVELPAGASRLTLGLAGPGVLDDVLVRPAAARPPPPPAAGHPQQKTDN